MNIIYIQDQEIDRCNGDYYHSKSEHFFVRYLSGISDNDTFTVYCGIKEIIDERIIQNYKKISHSRIKYIQIPEFRKLRNLYRIYKQIKLAVKNADFCYLRSGIASSIAGIICQKCKIPYMAIVNEDIYKNMKNHSNFYFKISAYPLSWFTHHMIRNANYACYVTQDYLQSRYPCNGESLGCSDIEFLELNDAIVDKRIERILKKTVPIILGSVGSVSTRIKGQDTVIRALAQLKKRGIVNYRYHLVGTGNLQYLRNFSEELGVADMIVFLGEYSHDNVLKWFETIDIYIHPSRSEGLPRTILEAMTKATTCVCSDVGGIPELINNEYLFRYNGNEVEDLINILLKIDIKRMKEESVRNYES